MNTELEISQIQKLVDAGIHLTVRLYDGWFNITAEEVIQYIKSPVEFSAKKHGVSVATWKKWVEHFENPQCCGKTKNGSRCKRPVRLVVLKDFDPNISPYCSSYSQYKNINKTGE